MTPLIDCTFLLLTFFMLTSHFASAEKLEMSLPRPHESQATDRRPPEKIILNVYLDENEQMGLRLGPVDVDSLDELNTRLAAMSEAGSRVEVVLRADRRLAYRDVRRVMEVVAANNLTRLQVAAELSAPE
jgi:biopolymer transport protein ExbD